MTALSLYYNTSGNWMEAGSGCGYDGNGTGWFNYVGGVHYIKSMAQCLVDEGFLQAEIRDPTGGERCDPNTGYAYMKHTCNGNTYLFAKMETLPQDPSATDGTCRPLWDTQNGMNYVLRME